MKTSFGNKVYSHKTAIYEARPKRPDLKELLYCVLPFLGSLKETKVKSRISVLSTGPTRRM